jgi:hypothetical protein
MKRMQTPFGLVEYDDFLGSTDALRGTLFHVPAAGRTPIYEQLRRETGLNPAPSEYDADVLKDSVLKHAFRRDTLRVRLSDYLAPDTMFLVGRDPRSAIVVTSVS